MPVPILFATGTGIVVMLGNAALATAEGPRRKTAFESLSRVQDGVVEEALDRDRRVDQPLVGEVSDELLEIGRLASRPFGKRSEPMLSRCHSYSFRANISIENAGSS